MGERRGAYGRGHGGFGLGAGLRVPARRGAGAGWRLRRLAARARRQARARDPGRFGRAAPALAARPGNPAAERDVPGRHHRRRARRADGAGRARATHEPGGRCGDPAVAGACRLNRAFGALTPFGGPVRGLELAKDHKISRWRPVMARKPTRRPRPGAEPTGAEATGPKSTRERIIEAFMALLAERPIEAIGLAEIARNAEVSLAELRGEFSSTTAIL